MHMLYFFHRTIRFGVILNSAAKVRIFNETTKCLCDFMCKRRKFPLSHHTSSIIHLSASLFLRSTHSTAIPKQYGTSMARSSLGAG